MAYVPTEYEGPAAGVAFDHPPKEAGLTLPPGVHHRTFVSESMGCAVGFNILLPPSCAKATRMHCTIHVPPPIAV